MGALDDAVTALAYRFTNELKALVADHVNNINTGASPQTVGEELPSSVTPPSGPVTIPDPTGPPQAPPSPPSEQTVPEVSMAPTDSVAAPEPPVEGQP